MPPIKKKTVKTVQKTKAVASSITADADEPPKEPPEPSITDISNFPTPKDVPVIASASDPELKPSTEPDNSSTFSALIDLEQASEDSTPKELFTADPKPLTGTENAAIASSNTALTDSQPASEEATPKESFTAENHGEEPPERIVTTSDEPSAKNKTKTIIRVRKVVRKKIVKRLVPKGSVASKKVDAKPREEGPVPFPEISEKNLNATLVKDDSIQQSSSTALAETLETTSKHNDNPQSAPENTEMDEAEKLSRGKAEHHLKRKEERDLVNSEEGNVETERRDREDVGEVKDEEMAGLSERVKRRKTEIFVGGLDKDAKEDELRRVFDKVGKILEVRMMMDALTGKNKGYAFLRYAEANQAKRALIEFSKVEICGKLCRAAAVQGNDTIFLGNIDKKWKKEDVIKLLKEVGIKNIDTVTVVVDPNNPDSNRGFAFLELETNKDAQRAYKMLQKKDVLGNCRNMKVAWAESSNTPDEDEMQKVKSVYVEGIQDSWDEDKLRDFFKKFGDIDRIVLGRNIKSTKRNDFAFINYKTREAALLCIECFSNDEITDGSSKLELKVSLAKRVQKAKQNQGGKQPSNRNSLVVKPKPILRLPTQDYSPIVQGIKRNFSALGDDMLYSNLRGYPQAQLDGSFANPGSSYSIMPRAIAGLSSSYYQHQPTPAGYFANPLYGPGDHPKSYKMRQGAAPPFTRSLHLRNQL